ncbi:MAG: hypothetical protein PHW63_10290, partial [Alphaproteobacteria bacterium]|nr:hypothetical protein [Alphaproteobacteria bacterium]
MVDPTNTSTPVRTLSPSPEIVAQTAPQSDPAMDNPATSDDKETIAQQAAPAATKPAARTKTRKPHNFSTVPFWTGMGLSILWVGVVALVMTRASAAQDFAGMPLVNWAIGISAIISPVAMIWMIAAYLQRAADVQSVTEPLRRQLAMITGESGAAEVRIRRFNHAIKEQLDLLRDTKHIGDDELLAIMDRMNDHKADLESFEQQSLYQVKEVQDVIRHSMQHIEQLMEDKFAMLRILDNKLVQSGDDVARQTESIRENISALLKEVETNSLVVASAVEKAMSDSKKLADTARTQETSLLSAAENASTTLSELSGKIDSNIAHFLSKAGMAREEAERMAVALDSQTRSIDELSSILPSRLSEAESVLRGVADRLYASEQLAREQATNLSEKIEAQVNGMQALLDRFSARVLEIDGGLQQRRSDLDGLVVRISGASDDLTQKLDGSITGLGTRADAALEKFAAANDEARKGTDAIASQLAETASRYEAATRHLSTVSEANGTQIRAMTKEISEQLAQFTSLQQASQQAGQDVQLRATFALQNLQQVLDRLLATRDATQTIGETLTDKLRTAVDQNERVITRINEAARMTVHALGIATESLGRQETDLTTQTQSTETALRETIQQIQDQAHAAESAMRKQNDELTIMLQDMRERLDSTDKRLQDFADYATAPVQQVIDQIDASTQQGSTALTRYGDDMQGQLERLQGFNAKISDMGQDVGRMTGDTLTAIEDLNRRFETIRVAQDEASSKAIEQFNGMAERLSKEVGSLGEKASEAVTTLQQAAVSVGQQTYQLQTEAKESKAKISFVTTALQNEAASIRETLEKQSAAINDELTQAGQRFVALGEQLKERTDTAYSLLDRVATHYNEATRAAAEDLDARTKALDTSASETTGKVQSLSAAMEAQLSLINHGAKQIETNAETISATSTQTIERVGVLNTQFEVTQKTAIEGTTRVIGRMEEAVEAFKEQHQTLNEAAEGSVSTLHKAGTAFGEQAGRLLDTTHQIEDSIRCLSLATTSFSDQSTQVRTEMDKHNERLITNLKESVQQLDVTNETLQRVSASAIMGADQAAARYNTVSESVAIRVEGATKELIKVSDQTETTLGALSVGITKQVAALNLVGEQIATQHKTLTETNDAQRTQLLDLFEKIGAAHGEASEIATRTISRLEETLGQVQNHMGELSDKSQTALADITLAGSGFADQSVALLTNAKQAEEQARAAITVTETLQGQAKQLRDALHDETKRTGEMLGDLLTRLSGGSDTIRDVGSATTMALNDLQMGITKQVSSLNESMDVIAARQTTLTTALESQREALSSLISRLTIAQDETASAAERTAARLTDGTAQINKNIEEIANRTEASASTIRTASDAFARETANLIANTDSAEQQTRKLLESAATIQKQAGEVCSQLRTETQMTEESIGSVVDKLQTNVKNLHETSQTTQTALADLGSTISQQTNAIDTNLTMISDKQSSLGSALDTQREMLSGMVTRLTLAQDETAAAAERSAARLTDSTGQIVRQMETLDTQTQSALAAVRAASTGLADEGAAILEHTKKAEHQVRDMVQATSSMNNEAKELRTAMKGEADQMIEQIRG